MTELGLGLGWPAVRLRGIFSSSSGATFGLLELDTSLDTPGRSAVGESLGLWRWWRMVRGCGVEHPPNAPLDADGNALTFTEALA